MASQIDPAAQSLFAQAQASEQDGEWQKAAEFYQAALADHSQFLEAHHNLALAWRQLGQREEALSSALSAALLAPDHPRVQFSLGVSLEQNRQIEDAIVAYRKAVSVRPNYVAPMSNLGRLLEQTGQIPESVRILERAYAEAPSSQDVRLNLANSYLLGGSPEKATELLDALLQENTDNALYHNSRGVAAHVVNDHELSIKHFRAAIKQSVDFAEAHENLAQALLFEENYDEAWAEYKWRWLN